MGTRSREKPARLAEKLRQVRETLGFSQTEMLKQLGVEDRIAYNEISKYELGTREPTLIVLLQYAHIAGIHVEDLIDDNLALPTNLPGTVRYTGIKSKQTTKNRRQK